MVRPLSKKYFYFAHRECEYFPCHPGAAPENFNCLYPHRRESYEEIIRRYGEIAKAMPGE